MGRKVKVEQVARLKERNEHNEDQVAFREDEEGSRGKEKGMPCFWLPHICPIWVCNPLNTFQPFLAHWADDPS